MSKITGYVISADKGLRIPKMAIDLWRVGDSKALNQSNTDYEGNFSFVVEPGTYWLECMAPFFDPIRTPEKGFIEISEDEEKEYEIRAVYTAL